MGVGRGVRPVPRESLLSDGNRSEAVLGIEGHCRQIFTFKALTVVNMHTWITDVPSNGIDRQR